ncbi:rab-interacting lysosomal protein isoform X4 [Phalacrocorax carbo]|uniref:rab-interacting lysosomal protein isoform X4 n=1 Tax=Phalacrocorax carbo TaxID=9209 RepID=UPI003119551A
MAEARGGAEPLWRTPPGRLAPPHVYRMAGALGSELRRLSGRFGPEAVAGLVPPVVRLLELLEALVAPAGAEGDAAAPAPAGGRQDAEDPEQRLWEAECRERALRSRLACLEEQNRQLLGQLAESQTQEVNTARKEREVMLRLKEVVDKQRDELRAQAHEIVCKSRDTEAEEAPSPAEEPQHPDATVGRSTTHCCFSKEELQQILQERNELKTNLFLVQEELAYYQRELLNEERVPSFFLDAMKSTIKRQRKKIRAKMLGTVEESASSDEDEGSWLPAHGADCVDAQPPESKIRSFFGLWYQGSSKDPPASSCSGAWEIIDSLDTQLEQEAASEPAAGAPDRAAPPL